jgi:hypothetical protein
LKKRTKKLLLLEARGGEKSATARAKIFCFFFLKKKTFLPSFVQARILLGGQRHCAHYPTILPTLSILKGKG